MAEKKEDGFVYISKRILEVGDEVREVYPHSRARSIALTKLDEARLWIAEADVELQKGSDD